MGFLSDEELSRLLPAEEAAFPGLVPTQIVSSDEYFPEPQTARQREVEARLKDMGDRLARRQGMSRRRFFQTASGMAAAFLAMNQVYGELFAVSEAEAATPEMADQRAVSLQGQDVFDAHTHFLRDDTRLTNFVAMRAAVGKLGWNKELSGKEQTVEAEGLLARCFQHEIDHLDGVLFTDRMAPGARLRRVDEDDDGEDENAEDEPASAAAAS